MKMSPNNTAKSIELWGPFRCSVASSEGFMQEAYCCVAENLESSSYPGLLRQFVWRVFLQKTGFRWACIHRGSMECTFVDWSVCRNNMEEFSNGRVNVIKHQVSFTVYIGSRHRFALCLHHALLRGATFGQRPTFLWGIGSEAVKPWSHGIFCGVSAWQEIGMLEPQFDTKEEDGKVGKTMLDVIGTWTCRENQEEILKSGDLLSQFPLWNCHTLVGI